MAIVDLWQGELGNDETLYQEYWGILGEAEQAYAGQLGTDLQRQRYLEVYGRLRKILAQTVNESPSKISIKKTEHGKPYLADCPEVVFNLSHSANTLIIAVSRNCQLGIDIEHCKPRVNLQGLVDKCFAEEESAYWRALPEAQKMREFYRFWTRKEAFVKATGRGIALGLNQCAINPENPAEFLSIPKEYGHASTWSVRDIDTADDICGALVADTSISTIRMKDWEA
jgi:4'-phosphopantetheinyl transferase